MKFYYLRKPIKFKRYDYDPLDENPEIPQRFSFTIDVDSNITRDSFLLISNQLNDEIYLGRVYYKNRPTTFDKGIYVKDSRRIKLNIKDLLKRIYPRIHKNVKKSAKPIELKSEYTQDIKDTIIRENLGTIDESYFITDSILHSTEKEIIPQVVDAFHSVFELFGLNIEFDYSLREEQIIDFEVANLFPGHLTQQPNGTHIFQINDEYLLVQKVHNTPIENCLGVDMIINFLDESRILFIQYKCYNGERNVFYKSQDRTLQDELHRMINLPHISNCQNFIAQSRSDLRLCQCPVFIKMCSRHVSQGKNIPYGYYYPICVFNFIYNENPTLIQMKEEPFLTNDEFINFSKMGLLGTTISQSIDYERYLQETSGDHRLKLIFTKTSQFPT